MTREERIVGGDERGAYLVDGNRLTPLSSGPDRLDALRSLIEGARRQLDLYFYIFGRDECAVEIREALVDACNRGVRVTLLVDAFGTATSPDGFFAPLVEAGVRFGRFGNRRSTRYLIRNHQKMAIADASRALVGGYNVERTYFAEEDDSAAWRDFALLVDGPLAQRLERWFDCLAEWTLGEKQSFRALRRMVREWQSDQGKAIWLMGGPTRRLNGWAKCVKHDLETGHRLDMAEAYFSPGWSMVGRLCRVARKGAARIVLPSRSDNRATIGAARHLYARLLRSRIELCEYQPQMLHAKLIAIDDVAYVGSANFDMRSLFLNVELVLRIEDKAFAEVIRAEIDAMAAKSRRIDKAAHKAMAGPFSRLCWWFDYLLVGVLDYTVTRRLNFRRDMPRD